MVVIASLCDYAINLYVVLSFVVFSNFDYIFLSMLVGINEIIFL